MADEAKWYVVHTYSGYENKVASTLEKTVENRNLQDVIQDVKVPTEKVTEIGEKGNAREVERKLFPGYVFIKMVYTDEAWYVVRNIRGCTGFVGSSTTPVPLSEDEWQPLPFARLLAFYQGRLFRTGTNHNNEYVENEKSMQLLYSIFASL